jgi:iron-sulfur cluster assembly protein
MISITPPAVAEIHRLKTARPDTHLYLTLGTGSCEQFYYTLNLVEQWPAAVVVHAIDSLSIGIDQKFSQFLDAMQIDFAQDLMGGGFRFNNPQALKVCGCGNAFTAIPDQADPAISGLDI